MSLLSNTLQTFAGIISFSILGLLIMVHVYFEGRDSAKNKQDKEALKNVKKSKEIEQKNSLLDDDDIVDRM